MNNVIQGSPEWFAQRLGRATASRIADVIAKTKSGYSTSRENYCVELALERITGTGASSFSNEAMRWGTETEPLAPTAKDGVQLMHSSIGMSCCCANAHTPSAKEPRCHSPRKKKRHVRTLPTTRAFQPE